MLRFDAVPQPVVELLVRLAPMEALKDFALGGGTSLALRLGHRWSVDLDFFTMTKFSPDDLFQALELEDAVIVAKASNSLSIVTGGVKLDLLRHAYNRLDSVETIEGIPLLSLSDMAAMKLNALTNRGSKKDFYDVAELLNHFSIQQMIDLFAEKYPATDPFTVIRSLAWFEDAELDPDPVALNRMDWATVKERTRQAVAKL